MNTQQNQSETRKLLEVLNVSIGYNRRINLLAGNMEPANMVQAEHNAHAQLPIIRQEVRETRDAIADLGDKFNLESLKSISDLDAIRDGLADIIVTVDGLRHRAGFSLTTILSSMSKDEIVEKMYDSLVKELNIEVAPIEVSPETEFVRYSIYGLEFFESCLIELEETPIPSTQFMSLLPQLSALLYVTVADIADYLNIDLAEDQRIVYESNLSKFDTRAEDAAKTVAKYTHLGVEVRIHDVECEGKTYFVVKSSMDQTVEGKHYPQNKFLKSAVTFKEPQW